MPNPNTEILIDAVQLAYGPHRVWMVCRCVFRGRSLCAAGGNGAGKSTTLSTLLGFLRADAGQVEVGGIDPARDPDGRGGALPIYLRMSLSTSI